MSVMKSMFEQAARARKVVLDHFTYVATWLNLGAGATVPNTIPISADSDFLWMETSLVTFTAVNVIDPAPDMLVGFTDTGSGRNLQDAAVHVSNITGNGAWPYVLPEPKLLIGNGGITITMTNNTLVAKARIDMALIGVKVFYISGFDRSKVIAGSY